MKRNGSYLLFCFLMLSLVSITQEITNVHFEQVGKQIHIYYDLQGDQEYPIQIFCSTDDGETWGKPLQKVSGAVGEGQKPGKKNKIVWDVLEEREKLSGDISFKIEAILLSGYFIDKRDGKKYEWVRIGKQVWMAENLNIGKRIYGETQMKDNQTIEKYCYDNNEKNCDIYGGLYQWDEMMQYTIAEMYEGKIIIQGICPEGWHLPGRSHYFKPNSIEWMKLIDFLEGTSVAGGKLKETGASHWKNPNNRATNESGFSALPGGYRDLNGSFSTLGFSSYWWSSMEYGSKDAWYHDLYFNNDMVDRNYDIKELGFSVRCVKD